MTLMVMKNPGFIIVCVVLAVAPLMRGSVHPWAQNVIQILVALGGIVLLLEAMRSRKPQDRFSREKGRVWQLVWSVAAPCAALGVWSAVMSPHPARAVQGLLMLLTCLGFFFLVVMSVRTRGEERNLVWVVVGTAGFLCVVGLLALYDVVVFPWWDYAAETGNAYRDSLTGAYVNRNHMAGFLEMAIPMTVILFITRSRSLEARIILFVGVVFLLVCQALTLSRGGWAGTAGALVFMAVALLFKRGFAHKRLVAGLLAGAVVTGAVVLASTPVVDRAATLTEGGIEQGIAHRLNVWKGMRLMIQDNPAAGTGPGTFEMAYPPYQQPGYPILVIYGHNDILQFASDTGILFFRSGFAKFKSPSRQTSGIAIGCMAAIVAILIHSYSDGNLHIPANALLFTTLSALTLK
jgi:O-antigen ligase